MICKVVKLNDFIYLTNDEEIKVGDWVYAPEEDDPFKIWQIAGNDIISSDKKIFATNNPSLEDVLQIPDEFLTICEENDEVEIKNITKYPIRNYTYISTMKTVITPVEKVQETSVRDENFLREEIIRVFGAYGAHIEIYDHLLKQTK